VRKPDLMAVTTALWRAAHLSLDAPPHVLEDDIGLRLVRDTAVLAAHLGPEVAGGPDAWLAHPFKDTKVTPQLGSFMTQTSKKS
jgi:hypothetical protein